VEDGNNPVQMTMVLTKCKYCDHGNPPDSKYCNSCGATLTLAPCPHCGAVNDVAAATCYQCRGNLQEVSADALVPALPATTIPAPATRLRSRAIVGTAVLAIVAVSVYYAYHRSAPLVPPPSAAANSAAKDRVDPAPPAPIAVPAEAPAAPVTVTATTAVVPASAAPAPLVTPPTSQVILRRTDSEVPARPEAAAVAATVGRPRVPETAKPGELAPPRIGPCTDRVAALGLCSPTVISNKEADAVPAATARPPANTDGKPCTEAVAALGLCTQ
jgi:hypothetical protein